MYPLYCKNDITTSAPTKAEHSAVYICPAARLCFMWGSCELMSVWLKCCVTWSAAFFSSFLRLCACWAGLPSRCGGPRSPFIFSSSSLIKAREQGQQKPECPWPCHSTSSNVPLSLVPIFCAAALGPALLPPICPFEKLKITTFCRTRKGKTHHTALSLSTHVMFYCENPSSLKPGRMAPYDKT